MEKTRVLLWILVGMMTMGGFAGMYFGAGGNPAEMLMQKRLEQALLSAEMGIECGYADSGFLYNSPTQAAETYLELLGAASAEMGELYGETQQREVKQLPHQVGLPGKPWTVVLDPSDAEKRLRLFGFGDDANVPLLQKEIICG